MSSVYAFKDMLEKRAPLILASVSRTACYNSAHTWLADQGFEVMQEYAGKCSNMLQIYAKREGVCRRFAIVKRTKDTCQ